LRRSRNHAVGLNEYHTHLVSGLPARLVFLKFIEIPVNRCSNNICPGRYFPFSLQELGSAVVDPAQGLVVQADIYLLLMSAASFHLSQFSLM